MKVPKHIVDVINTILAPYGETYIQGSSTSAEYFPPREAAKYLGVSKETLYRFIRNGELELVKLTPGRNGKSVVTKRSIDAFVDRRRIA